MSKHISPPRTQISHILPIKTPFPSTQILAVFEKISKGIVIFFSGIVLCFFSVTSFLEKAHIAQTARETCVFQKHGVVFYTMLLLGILLVFFVRNVLSKMDSKRLFLVLTYIYLIAGMYLIFNADSAIRADANAVFRSATAFDRGDFSSLGEGQYLARYPYQLGLATFERIFMIFSPNVKFFFTLNLLMILAANYMQWKISEIVSKNNSKIVNLTILLSFAFLQQLFYILFVYGLIPGFCFSISAVYFMIRYFRERDVKSCVFSMVLIAVGCIIRNNFMIAAIAMAITYLLDFFRSAKKRSLLLGLVVILCAIVPSKGVDFWYQHESGIDFDPRGTPKLLWITMGLQDSDPNRMGGWYNGYVANIPKKYDYDYSLALERGKADLKERLGYFEENPSEASHFFINKAKSTWLDPLFQSTWSGPLADCKQYMKTKPLADLYNGKGIYRFVSGSMNVLLVIIYSTAFLYMVFVLLLKKEELTYERLFPYIFLLGGFFFHLVWETKSQYVYPYVFMLIPVAAMGIELVSDQLIRSLEQVKKARA